MGAELSQQGRALALALALVRTWGGRPTSSGEGLHAGWAAGPCARAADRVGGTRRLREGGQDGRMISDAWARPHRADEPHFIHFTHFTLRRRRPPSPPPPRCCCC
eukprot:COSAG01_NODE_2180_length_8215_cov_3.853006_10_plen_105_part_00